MADRIQIRRDTAANWTSVNPVLAAGECGLVSDTNEFVIGDGSTAFTSLTRLPLGLLAGATFTGPVELSDGSAAAPSLPFASDLDTGLYRVGSGRMHAVSNGSDTGEVRGVKEIYIPAQQMFAVQGSPVMVDIINDIPAWSLDPTTIERVGFTLNGDSIPLGWTSLNINYYFTQTAGGSGNVVLAGGTRVVVDGEVLAGASLATDTVAVPSVANELKIHASPDAYGVPAPGGFLNGRVGRSANDAADTYASDIYLLGIGIVDSAAP